MQRSSSKIVVRAVISLFVLTLTHGWALSTGCDGSARCYVRSGASGSANGSDWTNAYRDLPSSLVRGVTYYVAAGTYRGHLFKDADSGSTYITVQAPTTGDHGTDTGWSAAYQGQAVFNTNDSSGVGDVFTFQSDYYMINGVYRSSAAGNPQVDWSNEAGYGFKVDNSSKSACNADISLGDNQNTSPLPVHHITVQYVDVSGSHENSSSGCRENGVAGMWGSHDYTFQYNYVHDTGLTIYFLRGEHANCSGSSGNVTCGSPASGYGNGSNITVQYNYHKSNFSDPAQHAEGCSCSEGLQNLTFAYNFWQDINGTGIFATATGADWNSGNGANGPWNIYGNVIFESSCAGVTGGTKNPGIANVFYKWDVTFTAPIYFMNNTIYNFPISCNSGSGIALDDGAYKSPATAIYMQDNLWDAAGQIGIVNGCPSSGGFVDCTSMAWGYQAYFASLDSSPSNDSDSHKQVSSSAAPFMNATGFDLRLSSDTNAGIDTGSILAANGTDMLGVTRGSNGTWDRGAFQVSGSSGNAPAPPTNLNAVVQ